MIIMKSEDQYISKSDPLLVAYKMNISIGMGIKMNTGGVVSLK